MNDRERDELELELECRESDVDCGCEWPDEAPDEPCRKEVSEEEAMMMSRVESESKKYVLIGLNTKS